VSGLHIDNAGPTQLIPAKKIFISFSYLLFMINGGKMTKSPVFHKRCAKIQQQDFLKNIWCPIYEICIIEAAQSDTLLDCGECENLKVDFKENWEDLQHYALLKYAYEPLRS